MSDDLATLMAEMADDSAYDIQPSVRAKLRQGAAEITRLKALLDEMRPKGVCLTNRNIPDDMAVPLEMTMGDLRRIFLSGNNTKGQSDD